MEETHGEQTPPPRRPAPWARAHRSGRAGPGDGGAGGRAGVSAEQGALARKNSVGGDGDSFRHARARGAPQQSLGTPSGGRSVPAARVSVCCSGIKPRSPSLDLCVAALRMVAMLSTWVLQGDAEDSRPRRPVTDTEREQDANGFFF